MAHLPPRKQHSTLRDVSGSGSGRNFGNSTYSGPSSRAPCGNPRPPWEVACGDAQGARAHGSSQPRPLAWGEPLPAHDHDNQPIITEAARLASGFAPASSAAFLQVRRERDAQIENAKQKAALNRQRARKNEQFQRELETFKMQNTRS